MKKIKELKWDDIHPYLKNIGIKSPVDIERVGGIFDLGETLCPEQLRTIFISNYRDTNGKDEFKGLWFFSDKYVLEALDFNKVPTPKLEMAIFKDNIVSVAVEAENFDFTEKALTESKLHIEFDTLGQFNCDLTAFGQNCDKLCYIFKLGIPAKI